MKTRRPKRGATRGASRSVPPARPPDRPRSPGQPIFGLLLARRRLLVALTLGLMLIVAGVALRGTIRHDAADFLGVRLKNQVLALWTIAVAPPLDTADLAPIAHDDVPPFAVNVFLDQEVQLANVDRSLDLVRALGFHFIKQELVWSDVERPSKGQFVDSAVVGKSSWDNYDRIVEEAQKRGIEVIFRIDTSPAWARPGTDKIETPPLNYQDYADFVATVVQRYQGRVHYYQIWNEPNWAFEWGDHVASPSEYVILLKMAYTSAKAVDPNATILSASLAPTIENSDRAESDVTFLQEMYDAGAKPYFDVLSANAYGLRNGPDDWRFNRTDDVNFARPVLLRETMVRNGDQGKPIWASEIGWDALPADWSQYPLLFGSVSRALQAEYTVRAYQRAAEQWPWMDVMAVWHLRKVHPADAAVQDYYFDLVSTEWQLEPVYLALQQLAAEPTVVHRGYHQESYWGLSWGPGWQHVADPRAVLGGYQETSVAGAQLDFDLDASWLDLVTTVGPGRGAVSVTVDGSPLKANRLPIEGGQAILNLTGPAERWQVRQPIADALGPGVHHVTLRVLRGDVAIDGLVADRESPRDQLYWQLSGGLLGLALLVAAWRSRGRPQPSSISSETRER